jgi:hypothetical protein
MSSAREVDIKQSELNHFYSLAIGMKPGVLLRTLPAPLKKYAITMVLAV